MAGPWEQYAPTTAVEMPSAPPASAEGPWTQYATPAAATAPSATPTIQMPRSFARAAGDLGIGLGEGAVSAGMFLPQLANTLTGGAVDKYAFKPLTGAVDSMLGGTGEGRTLAQASQDTRSALDELKSPQLRQKEQELSDTKGFLPTVKKIITNPTTLGLQQVAEQVPQLVAPGGVVRKAGAVAFERAAGNALARGIEKRVAAGMSEEAAAKAAQVAAERLGRQAAIKAGTKAAIATEAVQSGSQNSEQAQQEVLGMDQKILDADPEYQALVAGGMSAQEAREARAQQAGLRAGAASAAITAATGGLTGKLESKIFQGETGVEGLGKLFTGQGAKELAKATGKETLQEGLQEGGEQFGQNLGVQSVDPNKSLMDQVPENAALGAVIGGTLGGGTFAGSAALSHPHARAVPNPGAAPGSLSDAANVLHRPAAGPIGRAAQEAVVSGAADAAQVAQASANPNVAAADAAPSAQATRVAPAAPPWMDVRTGELAAPSKDELASALADHMIQQRDASGDMRVNTQQLADAWGVTNDQVKRARPRATQVATARIAEAERAAMNPQPVSALETGNPVSEQIQPDAGATNERVPEPAPAEAAGVDTAAAGATDAGAAANIDSGAAAGTGEPLASGPAAVAGEHGPTDANPALTAIKETANGTAEPGVVPQGDSTAGGNSGTARAGRGNEESGSGSAGGQAPGVAAEAPAQEAAAPRAAGTEAAAAESAPAVAAPEAKATRAASAGGGATRGGSAPLSDVHVALRQIVSGEHPEKVLSQADEPTVRAVAKALGRQFSAKAPVSTIIAKLGADRAATTVKAADALVKMGGEKPASAPALTRAPLTAKPATQTLAARKAETLRVKTPDGEVNGRTHINQLVKRGFTQLSSTRAGDKMVHTLSNAAGESEPIHARQLAYAEEVVAKANLSQRDNSSEASKRQDGEADGSKTAIGVAPSKQQPVIQTVDQREGSDVKSEQSVLPQLRGEGDNTSSGVGGQLPSVRPGRGSATEPATHAGSNRQQPAVPAREHAVGDETTAGKQSAEERQSDLHGTNADIGGVGKGDGHGSVDASLSDIHGGDASRGSNSQADKAGTSTDLVDAAASEAAAHPGNDKPEPTAAQVAADNFAKGHLHLHGLDIAIEIPKGGMRRGVDAKGNAWERELQHHYGAIRGTTSADGENVDVYLGPHAEDASKPVFVIDQVKPGTKKFDESKVMLGYTSGKEARAAYDSNFPKGLKTFGAIHKLSLDEFKAWLKDGDTTAPLKPVEAKAANRPDVRNGSVRNATPQPKAATQRLFSQDAEALPSEPPFYSAALRTVEQAKGAPRKADAAGWKGWLDGAVRRGDMKQSEREWLGIDQWLAQQTEPVTRDQLAQFVRDNQVQVKEVTLGAVGEGLPDGWKVVESDEEPGLFEVHDAQGVMRGDGQSPQEAIESAQDHDERTETNTKFANYQLPGGANYKELLLTLPAVKTSKPYEQWLKENFTGQDTSEARKIYAMAEDTGKNFQSGHFEQSNILAHVRFNERTDADGKKMLFLEEVQSDWHQIGRKHGYLGDRNGVSAAQSEELRSLWVRMREQFPRLGYDRPYPGDHEAVQKIGSVEVDAAMATAGLPAIDRRQVGQINAVPDAPFKSTSQWSMLAFKRMARYAAENGFERIGWTTGEQQAARYDLSKQVDSILHAKNADGTYAVSAITGGRGHMLGENLTEAQLEDNVGKDVAKKIVAGEGKETEVQGPRKIMKSLSGVDLKVGGEGMKAFYDKMLPAEVNKWGKPFGAKASEAPIQTNNDGWHITPPSETVSGKWMVKSSDYSSKGLQFDTEAEAKSALAEKLGAGELVHSIDITPAMRTAALGGQPLFRRGADFTNATLPTAEQSAHTAKIKAIATDLTKAWKGDDIPRVQVVDTPEELPAIAKIDPATGKPDASYKSARGMYDGRTVWIVASKHADTEAGRQVIASTLAHEVVGHYGIDRILTRELGADGWANTESAIERLRTDRTLGSPAMRSVLDSVERRYKQQDGTLADPKTYAREVLAVMAERGVHNGLLDRAITALRRFIRKFFPDLALSERELRKLLVHSKDFIERGETQTQRVQSRAALAFSSDGADATDTPAFREFFGNSKVVDAAGDPLPVYHGTAEEFDTFDPKRSGSATAHMTANLGTFFAEDQAKAKHYAENASQGVPAEERVVDAYLSIQKPYSMSLKQFMGIDSQEESAALRNKLIGEGYDGIHLKDIGQWVAFHANQIKSASENRGTFDRSSGNIYFSRETNDRGERDEPGKPTTPFSHAAESMKNMDDAVNTSQESLLQKAKDWLRGKYEDFVPKALGALQRRFLTELMGDHPALKSAKGYDELVQALNATKQQLLAGAPDAAEHPLNMLKKGGAVVADEIRAYAHEKGFGGWLGRKTAAGKELAYVQHQSTINGIDASEPYEKLKMKNSHGEYVEWTPALVKEQIAVKKEQMMGRSGDDKTAMINEIKTLRNLKFREKERAKAYPALVARFNAMPEKGQDLYRQQRDWYQQMSDAVQAALEARVGALRNDLVEGGSKDLADNYSRMLVQRIRSEFEAARVEGVYFPLNRDGDFWVSYKDKAGGQGFQMFESSAAQNQFVKENRRHGGSVLATGRRDGQVHAKDAPSGTFIADIMKLLKTSGAPEAVQDEVYQTFLRTLPEMSMRKHAIHRKAVPGFSDDITRGFAKNAFHGAHQLARLQYAHRLQTTIDDLQRNLDAFRKQPAVDPLSVARGDALLGELKKRHQYLMSPTDSQLANVFNSIAFTTYLGLSPASALVNMTQNAQVTLPVLGAQHGWPSAVRELSRAMRDSMRTGGNIERTLTDDEERRAYNALRARGDIDKTRAHDLAGLSEGSLLATNPVFSRVMAGMTWMFHKAEVVNREAAGMAAYRLARARGDSFNDAVKYASDIINGTHFDYSADNRPPLMQGNTARIAFQFKNYSISMTQLLYRNLYQAFKGETPEVRRVARRTLTGMMTMTGLLAGAYGLPIMGVISAAASMAHAAFGDDDDPWDFETEARNWLAEHFGDSAAGWITDGAVSHLAGVNIANRVSMSDMWFRDPDRQLEGKDAYYNLTDSLLGPTFATLKNVYIGKQMIAEGHTQRGIETMLPTFAKNAMKAYRYASQGVNNIHGAPIVSDISGPEAFAQFIGLQPERVAEQQRINSAAKNYGDFVSNRRTSLRNAYAMAVESGDGAMRGEVQTKIVAFNRRWPLVAIKPRDIRAAMKGRARAKTEPNGISLNKKLAGTLQEMVNPTGQ